MDNPKTYASYFHLRSAAYDNNPTANDLLSSNEIADLKSPFERFASLRATMLNDRKIVEEKPLITNGVDTLDHDGKNAASHYGLKIIFPNEMSKGRTKEVRDFILLRPLDVYSPIMITSISNPVINSASGLSEIIITISTSLDFKQAQNMYETILQEEKQGKPDSSLYTNNDDKIIKWCVKKEVSNILWAVTTPQEFFMIEEEEIDLNAAKTFINQQMCEFKSGPGFY